MTVSVLAVHCPTCQKNIIWDTSSPFRPFCSKRCQLIDLGEWANETHKIASAEPLEESDLEQIVEQLSEELLIENEYENFKY